MPVEEMIWSKAFLMERERFDGADVLHLVRARQHEIDWPRLLSRFGEHWRVLLSHLVLFPERSPNQPAPEQVIDGLLDRAKSEMKADEGIGLCRGPLLSRAQYLVDVERWNYVDAREVPLGTMTPEEIADLDQRHRDQKITSDRVNHVSKCCDGAPGTGLNCQPCCGSATRTTSILWTRSLRLP